VYTDVEVTAPPFSVFLTSELTKSWLKNWFLDKIKSMFLLFLLFTTSLWAQITDASFFPSVRSINPGVVHMRRGGLVAFEYGQKKIEKQHDVTAGGIVGGIQTNVNLKKNTLFATGASRLVSAEMLVDNEKGKREESISHPTRGDRTSDDDASSNYYGAIIDFRYFGVSYAKANYKFFNEFRVGSPPDLSARDEEQKLNYTNLKVGSAIKFYNLRVGVYALNQKAEGDYTYTFYDSDGIKGTTENFPVTKSAKGYGMGLGFALPRFRSEVSMEKMYGVELDISDDYPRDVKMPTDSSRITALAEARIYFFSVGFRFRKMKGNYVDLEDIISTNLLYDSMGEDDTRTETSFNFSLGDNKGFSPSIYYTQSKISADEVDPIFATGDKYKAETTAKAFGVNLSYRF
jgi:hypothetical protein